MSLETVIALILFLGSIAGLLIAAGRWMAAMHYQAKQTNMRIDTTNEKLHETCKLLEGHVSENGNEHKDLEKALTDTNKNVQQLAITATAHEGRLSALERERLKRE